MGTSQGCLGEGVGALAPWLPITVRNQHVLFGAMLSPHGQGLESWSLQGQCANGLCRERHRVWAPSLSTSWWFAVCGEEACPPRLGLTLVPQCRLRWLVTDSVCSRCH